MKKANFTTTIASMVVLVALVFGTMTLNAQVVKRTCGETAADTGTASGPYNDNAVQTIEVCPTNSMSQVVRIVFNQYDVAVGDLMRVYSGKGTTGAVLDTTFAGSSVANAPGGGWIDAPCDEVTGCLTLVFTPNNDGTKGAGYVFTVECLARPGFSFPAAGTTAKFTKVTSGCVTSTPITVTIPTYSDCDGGSLIVSSDCADATIVNNGNGTLTVTAPIGQTTLTYTSPLFSDKKAVQVIALLPPTLTCNDDVNVSLINECTIALTPDMLLENPCPIGEYDMFFTDPHVVIIGTTIDGYPIADFSGVPCGTRLDVKVTRTIEADCGNDFVDICWGQITIEDKVDPILNGEIDEDLIACFYDQPDLLARLNAIDARGGTIRLKPLEIPSNIPTAKYSIDLVINPVASVYSITENCEAGYVVGAWQAVDYDCTTGAFTGLIANAGDPLWALMAVEVEGYGLGSPAIFKSYFRVVKAVDRCGNESNISIQRVVVAQPDIVSPQLEIELPCGSPTDPQELYELWASDPDWYVAYATYIPNYDPTPLDVNGNFSLFGGLDDTYFTDASGDEVPASLDHADCGYAIDWDDSNPITVCTNSFKIFREWTVYNWCDGHLELIDLIPQVIKVGDTEAPELEFLGIVGTGNSPYYNCSSDAHILIEVSDDCSQNIRSYVDFLGDNVPEAEFLLKDGKIFVPNVKIATPLSFTIRLIDDCGNDAVYGPFSWTLSDVIPPVAICESSRVVSMGLDCEVLVPAEAFDDGSYDNCGTVSFSVARMDEIGEELFDDPRQDFVFYDGDESVFKPFVKFTKEDLTEGCSGSVRVVFRVEDGSKNVNFCMVDVTLQDKIPPVVLAQDIKLDCDATAADDFIRAAFAGASSVEALLNSPSDPNDPADVAYIVVDADNCDNARFIVDAVNLNAFDKTCRKGTIVVTFQAIDACGNVSLPRSLNIILHPRSDWSMVFPIDAEVLCENNVGVPAAATADQILTNRGCDFWGLEVNEEQFDGESGACFKIVREYHWINWCTWSPNNTELAVVERPKELILSSFYKVALRYRDANRDNINDVDDGNEDLDFNTDQYGNPVSPRYIYRSTSDRVATFQPIRIPFNSTQLGRINDSDEVTAFDAYDVTGRLDDADFVVIDRFDLPYQNIAAYPEISQFSGVLEHYVSAQAYGNIVYRQIIKVNDVTAPAIAVTQSGPYCGGDTDPGDGLCTGNVTVKFNVTDLCSKSIAVSYRLIAFEGTSGQLSLSPDPFGRLAVSGTEYSITGTYPIGKHKFVVTALDKCANRTVIEIPFEVKDCKAPTPYCIFGLSADLMPNGTVVLWAEDFDAGSFDFCSDVTLTFANPTIYPDSIGRTFRCADGEIGVVAVELWAQDAAGNTAFCETFINIQANPQVVNTGGSSTDLCPTPGAASIAGAIQTEDNKGVTGVAVSLSGNANATSNSNTAGGYQFVSLEAGFDYTVTPAKDDAPLNGVSTFDLVLISKHILGVELLNSPYKLIAADVNNSGSITTFDMVTLRKVILNVETNFPGNTSWRFIPKDYTFTDAANPFGESFPEVMNFNDLAGSYANAHFVAVKVGDVNASAVLEARTMNGTFTLNTADALLAAGETTTMYFTGDLASVAGYQFTMELDGLEIVEVQGANADNFGLFDGALTASWNGTSQTDAAFSLVVKATRDTRLSQAVRLTSSKTTAEAYSQAGALQAVALNFTPANYELSQNTPNPFKGETLVVLNMPTAQQATLNVQDLNGRVLFTLTQNFVAGRNEIKLNSKQLQAGVLYYTLQTADFNMTKKMVVME